MASREEEICRLLNSNPVLSAANGQDWQQLVSDYFLDPTTGDSCDSESSEDDSASSSEDELEPEAEVMLPPSPPPVIATPPLDVVNESEEEADLTTPLFVADTTADILQKPPEDYATVLERASAFICGCKLNQDQPCSALFSPEEMVVKRDQIHDLTPGK